MTRSIETLFDENLYPIGMHQGRDLEAGHLRGWGLEYGGLVADYLQSDPIYRAACDAARSRGSLLTEHKLANLYLIIRYAMRTTPGDIYEFGSFMGGSAVFMATILKLLGRDSKVYAFDTYEGMPKTDPRRDMHQEGDFANTGYGELLAFVRENGLESYLETVKGRFDETLPGMLARCSRPIAIAHIDCDIYEPIKYVIEECLPALQDGSYLILDDPLHGSCLGAFDAVQEILIRKLGLTAEQAYPHLVFRYPPERRRWYRIAWPWT